MYWQSQWVAPSCLHMLCQLLHIGSCTQVSPWVLICLRNLRAHPTVIHMKVIVGKVATANWVPLVTPQWNLGESACGHWKAKGWIFDELELRGMKDWLEKEQKQVRDLIIEWEHLFAHSGLNLGKISLIKHYIELTVKIPFKECYHWISPHMYEDVKANCSITLDTIAQLPRYTVWHAQPEVWVLAGWDGWGEQTADHFYSRAVGILQMWKNAFQVDQCPCHLSAVDANLPWGSQPDLVYHLPRWHCHLSKRPHQPSCEARSHIWTVGACQTETKTVIV